ncbi:MAG: cytochrome P450 [Acidimicrobiales bacterium]
MGARSRLQSIAAMAAIRFSRWRGDPLAALLTGAGYDDPYPIYVRMRPDPLHKSRLGVYATADHATAAAVLRDGRFSSSPSHRPGYRPPGGGEAGHGGEPDGLSDEEALLGPETSLLTMDPPDHTRIRRLVASAFTRRATDALEQFVRETAAELLDRVDVHAGFDLVDSVAFPLPIAVICHLLGVPAVDRDRFRAWGHDVAMSLEPRLTDQLDPALAKSERALTSYLRELIAERRREPDGTLLSALVAAEEEGDRLDEAELVSTALLLLVAGFETTVNLLANGTAALIAAPALWSQLREEPHRWPDAVEELLRFDSPVQMTSRIATDDLELAGVTLPRGSAVLVSIGGANRDPAVFADPDRLVLGRPDRNHHLSFSLGIHHCLGAALARLEAKVAFEELAARMVQPVPAGPAVRRRLVVMRGFDSLPVRTLAPGERAEVGAAGR